MNELLAYLISGAVAGSLYAIVGSSLVLTYTTSGVFNFAQGGIAFVTALLYFELNTGLGWPILPSAVLSILVFAPLVGLVLDRLIFRGLSTASETTKIVATVALGVALPAMAIFFVDRAIHLFHWNIASADNVVLAPGIGPTPPKVYLPFEGVAVNTNQLITLGAAVLCAIALWIVVRRMAIGLRMRAVVDRRELASLKGIDPDRTSSVAWMLSTTLAGLAGVLAAPILALGPASFFVLMLIGATAAVFARLRSIPLALAAGLGLGIVQNLSAGYVDTKIDVQGFSSALPYILLFVGLLFLLRDRRRAGGTASDDIPPSGLLDEKPKLSRGIGWGIATVGLVLYTLFIANDLWVGLVAAGLALGVIFMSFTIVTGIGGMVSLAQATFVTAAGLALGQLLHEEVPFLLAAAISIVVAALIGAAVALPALRLGGVALGLATLALAFVADLVIFQFDDIRNADLGWPVPRPDLGPLDLRSDKTLVLVTLAVVFAVVWLVRGLQRSASGRAAMALRSSPIGAASSGIAPMRTKLGLFAVSGAIAGLGGVLYVTYQGHISNGDLPPSIGLIWLAIVVLFGVRRPAFAVVAGITFSLMPQFLSDYVTTSPVVPQIIFGLGAIGLAKSPDGWMSDVAGSISHAWARRGGGRVPAMNPVESAPATAAVDAVAAPSDEKEPAFAGGSDVLLVVQGLRAGYADIEVLHGIDLVIRPGSFVAVVGANGAGKSTLAMVLSGLVTPTAGRITFEGVDITSRSAFWRARQGVLLTPEARGIFPGLTVEENLRLTLDDGQRHVAYERFPHLAARRNVHAGVLSGGEQQILTLAPLVAKPPRLLVADEPSLGLAPQIVDQVFEVLLELRSVGVGLMVIEEKTRDVLPVADEVVVLELGRVAWVGTPDAGDVGMLTASYLGMAEESPSMSTNTN